MPFRFSKILLLASALTAAPAFAQTSPADDIVAMRAQLEALQKQLNALQAAQAAQAAQVAEAIAAPAPPPPMKPEAPGWWKGTSVSGKAFFNVSNINQKSDGADGAQSGTQTELKRFYIGVDHKFSDVFSANLTTDFRYGANGTSKDVLVYVKKAYVQAKLSPALFVRVGSADLPWVPFAEGVYGYRFVENELIDRTKFGTSADWGVHAGGTLANGLVSYAVSAINGAGYKTLSRSSDTIDLEGRISISPMKIFTIGIGGYTGKLGKSAANLPDTATPHTAQRFNALAAYTGKRARLGVEYFAATNWTSVTSPVEDKADGWSTFGSFAFTPKVTVFGRYDWVKPNKVSHPDLRDQYFNVGVNYKPIPPLDLALVYKRDRAENGLISTSNGTVGGTVNGTYDEVGIFGQVAF
ncbi:MAG: hypothetical protein ABIO80_05985 [Sphingomicrobium sp.]